MKGNAVKEFVCTIPSPVGLLTVASNGQSITGLWIARQKYFAQTLLPQHIECELPIFEQAKEWLAVYFSGSEPNFMPSLAPSGTQFRQSVWKTLCSIPYGQVTTYAAIAKIIAKEYGKERMSAQAVGGAVGHNPISIMIPCHRVIGTNGSLTGYAGGISKKVQLLELESADMTGLFAPAHEKAL